jgi:hypothetical protein
MVAIGSEGQTYVTPPGETQDSYGRFSFDNFELRLEEIREFAIEKRPFEWVEFKNVSLVPRQETQVKISIVEGGKVEEETRGE